MATPTKILHRIRRARRKAAPPPTTQFDAYRPAYERLLTELAELAGEDALDELGEWATDEIERTGALPTPETLRSRAREYCQNVGIEVPEESPLAEK